MTAAVTVPLLAGLLGALVSARAVNQLRPGARSTRSELASSRRSPWVAPDYASLLDGIARRVRSGSSLTIALLDGVADQPALEQVAELLTAGTPLIAALATTSPRDPDLALAVQALSATAHLGGPVAATLDEAAAVLRQRAAARAERKAHAAQARLSARVLTIVPLAFTAWNTIGSQRAREVYLSNVIGGICAACGVILNLVGWRWMRRIIGRS